MGLFDLFKKKATPKIEPAKTPEDFDHLDENNNLPWGWVTRNEAFTGRSYTLYYRG